ncbi:MAG: peptidylprolyl isomerase [Acidobacteria bacterium]|nr:MAG: peptidylprolyl isomerase [Acidobacteriota bacterium]
MTALLKDYDGVVATAAAAAIRSLTGEAVRPAPVPVTPVHAIVRMKSGGWFGLDLGFDRAPLAAARFVRLVESHYYDGLSFHRVVSNFVIQGGSPGANEYAGDRDYMRDEMGVARNTRGSVGVSTRGANTGDAQLYINLVTNQRLDGDFTIFATVAGARDAMSVVDQIAEGDEILRIEIIR